ncbi:MAG TPA: hypothetical protein VFJ64_02420 [Solirubrobacterales bacterium]|nr:hypothetical protein [Solirubrobacterales bacterium]
MEADLGVVEDARGVLLRGDLADDRPLAFGGGAQPQRDRDRGLADAPLAGDEDQSLVEKIGYRVIPSNFSVRRVSRISVPAGTRLVKPGGKRGRSA